MHCRQHRATSSDVRNELPCRSHGPQSSLVNLYLKLRPAYRCGLRLIQVLPVNDTCVYGTWYDSYPYSTLSVHALHPQVRMKGRGPTKAVGHGACCLNAYDCTRKHACVLPPAVQSLHILLAARPGHRCFQTFSHANTC